MERICVFRFCAIVAVVAMLGPAPGARAADLRSFETRHYRIHTDLDPILADDLARRMDVMHDVYAERLHDFVAGKEAAPRFEVYLFQKQRDYLKFAGQQFKNTGGVFMSGRNLLAAFLEGQGRDALRRTIQHEAFHQFAHFYISAQLPVWLNEGLAQVFEEGIWTGSDFILGQAPPRRIRQLQADLKNGRLIAFGTLTRMTPEQWSANLEADHDVGATQYNQSWAMVYFLLNARDRVGRERYRARLREMLLLIHKGAGAEDAFTQAFGGNVRGFQSRFIEFARDLKPTPEATLIEHQEVLADLLTELKSRGQTFGSMLAFKRAAVRGRYRLHYTRGQIKWHSDPNPAAYFKDLTGKPYGPEQLFLSSREGAPLPDIVCIFSDKALLRTRFHRADERTEHEVLVESLESRGRARAE